MNRPTVKQPVPRVGQVPKFCFHCGHTSRVWPDLEWVCSHCNNYNGPHEGTPVQVGTQEAVCRTS